jgi:outer membrane protein TolC
MILFSFCLFSSISGFSQEKIILKASDLLDLAVKNSKVVKISSAQVEAAKARLAQSRDRSLPNVGISGSFFLFDNPTIKPAYALRNLLGGGSSSGSGSSPAIPKPSNATLLQANASEDLFGGFKNKFTVESDKFLIKAAELKFQSNQQEVVVNALSAYYNIYKLMATSYLLNQDLAEQNRRVQDFQNLEKNGLLTRNDLLKAEVGASNIKLSILDINNALDIARYNFKIMLGLSENMVVELDTTQLFKDRTVKSKEEMIQFALDNRPDLQSLGQESESYKARVESAKSGYYPSVALGAGYVDAWIPSLLSIRNVFDVSLGARYSLTGIFTTKHQVQEARANLNASIANNQLLADQVRMAVNQNYLSYTEALQKIELDQDIIVQAAENYKILKNKYANSLATLTDLLDGELSLLQARLNQADARADAQVAYYNLLKSAGTKFTIETINQ